MKGVWGRKHWGRTADRLLGTAVLMRTVFPYDDFLTMISS
jgi:hypothetical protein